MALSIKTEEADRLARELARLTGETMTEAVTTALRERLERQRNIRRADRDLPGRLRQLAEEAAGKFRTGPVSQKEWDWASGDEE